VPIQVVVSARESQPRGAFGYELSYGDGTTDQNAAPQFCTAGSTPPQSQTWQFSHRYAAPGAYRISALVTANCTPDRATASATATIT
jgi:hypothetical protein